MKMVKIQEKHRREKINTSYKRLWWTFFMFLIVILGGILPINLVSANTWNSTFNSSLSHYWSFKEGVGLNVTDLMASNGNASFVGSPSWDIGINGYGLQVSSGNYVKTRVISNIPSGTSDFTASMWFKPNTPTGTLIFFWDGAISANLSLSWNTGTDEFVLYRGGRQPTGTRAITDGVFHQVAYTCSGGSGTCVIYVDGTSVATQNSGANAGTNITMGMGLTGGSVIIDESAIWTRALGSTEIASIYDGGTGTFIQPQEAPITLNLNSPSDNYLTINNSVTFNCSAEISFGTINNISLYADNELKYTENGSASYLELYRTIDGFELGGHTWYCDSYTDFGYTNATARTFNITNIQENSMTYNISTIENSMENFITNVSYNTSFYTISSAQLYYNGTTYSATKTISGNDVIFSKEITIPNNDYESNMSFKWLYSLTSINGTTYYNSTLINQYVNRTNASLFGNPYNHNFINFTIYDEKTRNAINASFLMTMNYGINSFIRSINYENTSELLSSFSFAFEPSIITYLVGGTVEYLKSGYVTKTYTLPNQYLTNATTNIKLYLLNSSDSTSFIIYVRDSSYSLVDGAVVNVQRYYADTDEWLTTEIVTTNYEGKAIGHFEVEDVNYRFLVYVNDVLRLTTGTTKVFAESSPYTITLTLEGGTGFPTFDGLADFDYTLTYSDTTETFTFTYDDSSSEADGGRLIVIRSSYGNVTEQTICDTSSLNIAAVLTCDISGESNGTYYAFAYNERTSATTLLETLIVSKSKDIVSNIGVDGLIWSAFLIIGIVMLGLYKPAIAVVFAMGSVIMVSLLGLASIPAVSIAAIIIIGVILLWGMKQ